MMLPLANVKDRGHRTGIGRAGGAMTSVSPWPIRPYRASCRRFIARLAAVTFLCCPFPEESTSGISLGASHLFSVAALRRKFVQGEGGGIAAGWAGH